MTTQSTTTTIEIRDNTNETRESPSLEGIPVFGWEWPDEAQLADFAEKNDRMEQTDQPVKDDSAYAALYFVS